MRSHIKVPMEWFNKIFQNSTYDPKAHTYVVSRSHVDELNTMLNAPEPHAFKVGDRVRYVEAYRRIANWYQELIVTGRQDVSHIGGIYVVDVKSGDGWWVAPGVLEYPPARAGDPT